MDKLERVKKVCKWLIFAGFADNESELALKMGYTKSSLSQILNKKVPLSDKFVESLSSLDSNINKVWITEGIGSMVNLGEKDQYGVSYFEKSKYFSEQNMIKSDRLVQIGRKVDQLENFTKGLLGIIDDLKLQLNNEKVDG